MGTVSAQTPVLQAFIPNFPIFRPNTLSNFMDKVLT